MKITIARKMGVGFGVLLSLVATLAVVVLFNLRDIDLQFSFVIEHDAPVIANAGQLLTLVVDMETGQRGYVITGKQEFLEPYHAARGTFSDLIAAEKLLVRDNPSQVRRLQKIEASLHQWQIKAAEPEIAIRRRILDAGVGSDHLQEMLSQGVGKDILDEIRIVATEMEQQFRVDGNMNGVFLVKSIQKCMVDQETGERGFLIIGKEELLDPYHEGQRELTKEFASLRSLIASAHDREATVFDLTELDRLYAQWLAEAAEPEIELRRQVTIKEKTQQGVENALKTSLGKSILDELRTVMDRMSVRFVTAKNEKLANLLVTVGKAIVDQETGQRGFLLTGIADFLQPFKQGGSTGRRECGRSAI
ncbi:MAG: CHASE3 domain-containing protein [Fuerstiella sp.]